MIEKTKNIPPLRAKFLAAATQRRLAPNTCKAYALWIRAFIKYHHPRGPQSLGPTEIASFLSFLVLKRKVSAASQHVALNAIVFLFRYVLCKEVGTLPNIPRGLRKVRQNNALTREEFQALLFQIPRHLKLVFLVMYGCGLRISEVSNLKMGDLRWDEDLLVAKDTKSRGDRVVRMPLLLKERLAEQVTSRRLWEFNLVRKRNLLSSKFQVERLVSADWDMQYVFVSRLARYDEKSKMIRHRPLSSSFLQRIFKSARDAAKLSKALTPHSLRYSFATEAVAAGSTIADLQVTLGHKDPNTTARYVDVRQTIRRVASPLDTLMVLDADEPAVNVKKEG